ncbi:MAG TPA: VWA domain-containing protein [Gaiellales bacterium]|jgi:hypothetical protein|nr:VWA domain-containing protein [Gaiellales bacterium]
MSGARRLAIAVAVLAGAAVCVPGACANITGSVTDATGVPLVDASIGVVDAVGENTWHAASDTTGHFSLNLSTASPAAAVFPVTLYISYSDRCAEGPRPALTMTITADGAVAPPVVFAVNPFCSLIGESFAFYPTDASAYADSAAGRIISPPGGVAYLHLQIPDRSSGIALSYAGAVIGAYPNGAAARVTAPAATGSGPLSLAFTVDGVASTRPLGALTVTGGAPPLAASPAGTDIELALDISGSMATSDPRYLRKAAVHDLVERAGPTDRLGAFAFDDQIDPLFDLQRVTAANAASLATLGDRGVTERGGTDFSAAFAHAYDALTAPAVTDPARRKYVILLTDGSQSAGIYDNSHLLLAGNASGRPWPICVVQLARRLEIDDVALLKRIAAETGGLYTAATTPGDLSGALDRCLGGATGSPAVRTKVVTFSKPGSSRQVAAKLAGGLASAAFRVDYSRGAKLSLVLLDPRARTHTLGAPGAGVTVKHSATAVSFRVSRPAVGTWRLVLTATSLVSGRFVAHVRITPVAA